MNGARSAELNKIPKDAGQFGVVNLLRTTNQAREIRIIMAKITLNLSGAEIAALVKLLEAAPKQTGPVVKLTEKLKAAVPAA